MLTVVTDVNRKSTEKYSGGKTKLTNLNGKEDEKSRKSAL
jgi:hypothetical protein